MTLKNYELQRQAWLDRAIDRGGTKANRARPESEWLTLDAPELRIIPDDISQRVRVGLDTNQQAYQRGAGGRIIDRLAKTDYESAYLFSGFLKCSVCGGSMIPTTRQTSRKNGAPPKKYYRCT